MLSMFVVGHFIENYKGGVPRLKDMLMEKSNELLYLPNLHNKLES